MEPDEKGQPAPQAPETSDAPAPLPEIVLPEKFAGKSDAELKKILLDLDSHVGKQAEELGNLRGEAAYWKTYAEGRGMAQPDQYGQTQPPQQIPPQEEPRFDTGWAWERPVESTAKVAEVVAEKKLREWEQRRRQEEQQREAYEAQANYFEGKEIALKQGKRLYEGIEQQVENAVYGSYRAGILNKHSLRNPKTWERAAQLIRLERGEYDRVTPQAPKPVSPTPSELPGGAKPWSTMTVDELPIELTEEDREIMRRKGLTDKEAIELKRDALKAELDGRNRGR